MPSRANSLLVATTAADVALSGPGVVMGFCLTETAGAVATAIIRDGTTATDEIVLSLKFIANETKLAWFGDGGITFDTGVFLDMVAGSIQGSIFVA